MLERCAQVQSRLHQTADHAEAVEAFLDRRAGTYQGK